jgi:glycosyltransferase involved in cell wall biosynthesis
VVGVGVDPPSRQSYPRHQQDPADAIETEHDEPSGEDEDDRPLDYLSAPGIPFRRRHRLYGDFALYGGRVAADNGSEELIEYYDAYAASGHDLPLVLMGLKMLKVPDAPYLRLSGVLPDRERVAAYEAASVTIAPGTGDLLAESTLESLAVGTPVLASTGNAAAVDHCREAGGGLCYGNREEFVEALTLLSRRPDLRRQMSACGRRYVREHHQWEAVVGRFERLVGRAR